VVLKATLRLLNCRHPISSVRHSFWFLLGRKQLQNCQQEALMPPNNPSPSPFYAFVIARIVLEVLCFQAVHTSAHVSFILY